MNLSVRGLSIFLMVLQLLAPLIHAHKNEGNLTARFHLPEFEQINLLSKNNSAVFVSTTQNDQIVTVSAGMKNNKRRFLFDDVIDFYLVLSFVLLTADIVRFIPFFIKVPPIKTSAFNLSLPRAPPLFLSYRIKM